VESSREGSLYLSGNILLTEYGESRLPGSAWPSPPTSAGILAPRRAPPRLNCRPGGDSGADGPGRGRRAASRGSGWTTVLMGIGDDEVSVEHDEFVAVTMELATYGIQLAESRRDHPAHDLTT
jgi:hypothetical protein